jgi:hypothetical protein
MCPRCGSRRIQRLYNAVNIGRGAVETQVVTRKTFENAVGAELDAHNARRDSARNAQKKEPGNIYAGPSFAVPISQLAGTLAGMNGGRPVVSYQMGKGEGLMRPGLAPLRAEHGQRPQPNPHTLKRDTDYAIKVTSRDKAGRPTSAEVAKQ